MTSELKPIIHHGVLQLARNSFISNCEIEALYADPDIHRIGRIWFNIPEKVFKYSGLDSNNNLIICIFGSNSELTSFISSLSSSLGSNLIGFQGNQNNLNFIVPSDTLTNTLNVIIDEISSVKSGVNVNHNVIIDEFVIVDNIILNNSIFKNYAISLSTTNSFILDSFSDEINTAKYLIELNYLDTYDIIEITLLHNNIDIFNLQSGIANLANISSRLINNSVELIVTPNFSGLNIKFFKINILSSYLNDSGIINNIKTIPTSSTQIVLDNYDSTLMNSAKYIIEAHSSTNYEVIELITFQDNISIINSQYGNINTGANIINLDTIINNGNVEILATSLLDNVIVKYVKIPIVNNISNLNIVNPIVNSNILDTFDISQIKTKKYLVEIISDTSRLITELLVTYDNLNVEMMQYGTLEFGIKNLIEFNSIQVENNIIVSTNSNLSNLQVKVLQIELSVPILQNIKNNDFTLSKAISDITKIEVNINGLIQSNSVYEIINSNILHFNIPLYVDDVIHVTTLDF